MGKQHKGGGGGVKVEIFGSDKWDHRQKKTIQLVPEIFLLLLTVIILQTFVPKYTMKLKLIKYCMPNILSEKMIYWENGENFNKIP